MITTYQTPVGQRETARALNIVLAALFIILAVPAWGLVSDQECLDYDTFASSTESFEFHSEIKAMATQGHQVIIATGNGLHLLDYSIQNSPVETARYEEAMDFCRQAVIAGNKVILTHGIPRVLKIFDISDPHQIILQGSYPTGFHAWMDANESLAVLHGYFSETFQVFDVSGDGGPILLSESEFPSGSNVYLQGNTAIIRYGSYSGASWSIVDLTDPSHPQLVTEVEFPQSWDLAFLNDDHVIVLGNDQLGLFDISNLENPVQISISAISSGNGKILIDDGNLYVGNTSGLKIYSMDDPANPVLTGGVDDRISYMDLAGDNFIYYSSSTTLQSVDMSSPFSPLAMQILPEGIHPTSLILDENHMFLSTWEAKLIVLELMDAGPPTVVAELDLPDQIMDMYMHGHHLFAGTRWGDLLVIDVSDPDHPALISSTHYLNEITAMEMSGSVVLLAGQANIENTTIFIEISDPESPQFVANVGSKWRETYDLVVNGNTLFVSGGGRLTAYDISDLFQIRLLSKLELFVSFLAIDNNRLYTQTDKGLTILDISNPSDISILGTTPVDYPIWSPVLDGNILYHSNFRGSVIAYDVLNPEAPEFLGRLSLPVYDSTHLAIHDGELWLSASGLYVVPKICRQAPWENQESSLPGPAFDSVYPNPFNPSINIKFSLDTSEKLVLSVYDLRGRLITELADEFFTEGSHSVQWNGRNDLGSVVNSGVYLVRLSGPSGVRTRQITLVK